MGLFVLRLLLFFIFLPLEESIQSYEHLIEEQTGEAICNQSYTVRDAHASFKRPGKYAAPRRAPSSGTFRNSVNKTLLGSSLNYVCAVQR